MNAKKRLWITGIAMVMILLLPSCRAEKAQEETVQEETAEALARGQAVPESEIQISESEIQISESGTQEPENETDEIDLQLAEAYFQEIKELIKKDNGALWGKLLDTPFLFIDAATGDVVANEADLSGILKPKGNLYTGSFPEDSIVANSVTSLGGKNYSMVKWGDYQDRLSRDVLFIHEMFHYHQFGLGLAKPDGMELTNGQLDEPEGRIYLKLEWAALNEALSKEGEERKTAIRDALTFRKFRQELYQCAIAENEMIIREGLPEYTGVVIASESFEDQRNYLEESYESMLEEDSFVRSFAYYSGSVIGVLLDESGAEWRKNVTYSSDLGEMLAKSYDLSIFANEAEKRRDLYGYQDIYQEETARKKMLDEKVKGYENLLINQSNLTIELLEPRIGFDPSNLIPYKDLGTIYPDITISDDFGILTLSDSGCLLSSDWKSAVISAKGISLNGQTVTGNGWTIQLNEGYSVRKADDNYIIDKTS